MIARLHLTVFVAALVVELVVVAGRCVLRGRA